MKKYSAGLVIFALILAAMLVLLISAFKPINSLIKPPKVEGENLDIQTAFEKYASDDYLLKQPIKGDYRSAYTFIDLDGDDDNEVIVFYSFKSEIDIVRMNVLDKVDGEWESIADFKSLHNQIQEIEFADLNGDKYKEIIVGWATYQDDYSKLLSVYRISDESGEVSIESVFDDSYSLFRVMDIDCDGKNDILNLKYFATGNSAEYIAAFLSYDNDAVVEKGSTVLDRSISSVTAVASDYNDKSSLRRIYIDGYKVDSGMATDCFSWNKENNEFQRYLIDGMTVSAVTSRTTSVMCDDINSDGIVEMPVEEFLPASNVISSERTTVQSQSLTRWVQLVDDTAQTIEYHLINSAASYSLLFDEKWLGKITVENDTETGVLTFHELKNENGEFIMGEPYFSIKTVSQEETVSYFTSNYDYLDNNKNHYYYYRIFSAGKEFGITSKKIEKSLIMG